MDPACLTNLAWPVQLGEPPTFPESGSPCPDGPLCTHFGVPASAVQPQGTHSLVSFERAGRCLTVFSSALHGLRGQDSHLMIPPLHHPKAQLKVVDREMSDEGQRGVRSGGQLQTAGHSRKGPDTQIVNVEKWSKIGFDGKKNRGNRSRCGKIIPLM